MPANWVEGWTAPQQFTLLRDGAVLDLTGMTVTLALRGRDGSPVNTSGKVAVVSAAAGTVTFTPVSGDLKPALSPYAARFLVTDSGGKVLMVPNGDADPWKVQV